MKVFPKISIDPTVKDLEEGGPEHIDVETLQKVFVALTLALPKLGERCVLVKVVKVEFSWYEDDSYVIVNIPYRLQIPAAGGIFREVGEWERNFEPQCISATAEAIGDELALSIRARCEVLVDDLVGELDELRARIDRLDG